MGRTVGTGDVSRTEFFDIKRDLKAGHYQVDVAKKYGRSNATVNRINKVSTWKSYNNRKRKQTSRGLLDTNLTKKQARAFLDMQLDLNLATQEREMKQRKIERLEDELAEYRNRETANILKKARASRSILRFIPFRRGE